MTNDGTETWRLGDAEDFVVFVRGLGRTVYNFMLPSSAHHAGDRFTQTLLTLLTLLPADQMIGGICIRGKR